MTLENQKFINNTPLKVNSHQKSLNLSHVNQQVTF